MGKTSNALALASLAAVLLSTVTIGSTLASSKVFTNSGNIINTHQNCTAGNSCTLSSSNVINQEPTSTTTSPPCGDQDVVGVTSLTLNVESVTDTLNVQGEPTCLVEQGGLVGENITFTGTGIPSNFNIPFTTISGGQYFAGLPLPTTPGTYTVQAHFAGGFDLQPSNSPTRTFTVQ